MGQPVTGVMGCPMAGHLARAGHQVTVYNRSPAKARAWLAEFSAVTGPGVGASTGAAFAPIGLTIGAGSPAVFDAVGNLAAQSITGTAFKVGINQVVGGRDTGWGAATGGSKTAFNAATATLAQTSAALASLIASMTAHGLIGA